MLHALSICTYVKAPESITYVLSNRYDGEVTLKSAALAQERTNPREKHVLPTPRSLHQTKEVVQGSGSR
jgi:hypothetical protein